MLALVLLCLAANAFGSSLADTKEICCVEDGIGCFSKEGVFSHLPLPECPNTLALKIGMYTRGNKYEPYFIEGDLPASFDGRKRTIFVVHGYMSDYTTYWLHEVKDLVLEIEDANIIIVGWEEGASKVYYPQAASNTRSVGAAIATLAKKMRERDNSVALWCVGFSLGSHLCGHMGSRVHLQRITGLDPAGPSFDSYDLEAGLNPDRAELVDVIHTDGWGIFAYYGTLRPLGHVDYYPNGGYYQPGCWTREKKGNTSIPLDDSTRVLKMIEYGQAVMDGVASKGEGLSCSHSRAPKYFLESIRDECFISREVCDDFNELPGSCRSCPANGVCGVMGYFAEKYQHKGLLYHETTGKHPYCPSVKLY